MNEIAIARIDRIAALEDPVHRNFQITQCYYELSLAFSERTGPRANWCSFAIWASRQAGQTIRKEDLNQALEDHLNTSPIISEAIAAIVDSALLKGTNINKKGIIKLLWETINLRTTMNRASDAVARGNQKVFAEIGREFARFMESCRADDVFNVEHIDAFCKALKAGDPPDGQRYLQQAFRHYYQSFFESDPQKKAELVLHANLEIGFHEQTRLQPEITEALEASIAFPADFKDRLLLALFPNQSWINQFLSFFSHLLGRPSLLDKAIDRFTQTARQKVRFFLTDHLMTLELPNGQTLKLDEDLSTEFPTILKKINDKELHTFLQKIDPTPDSLEETGTLDWANLPDRLHFICDLFRSYQENKALLERP